MKWLSGHGQSSKVYATFENGFCYEYMPGYVLNVDDLVDPSTWPQIAQAMAHIHQLGLGDLKPEAGLFTMFDKFLALLPETPDIKQTLEPEVEFLRAGLPKPQPEDLVFCHNDLLARNIIKQKDKIIFIDFEYGCPNHRAFDIANHFTEFCGVGASYGRLPAPDRAFMQAWCKVYLSHIDQDADEATLEKLVTQVEAFIPSTHLLWAIWCFAQSSRTNFDYENYGNLRLRDYFLTKSNLDKVTN
ncbi:Ethanolamine kinase 2 [Halotydeus destructor]|nr:Ethanolamine kinase 2 [Halotydeus destructor]